MKEPFGDHSAPSLADAGLLVCCGRVYVVHNEGTHEGGAGFGWEKHGGPNELRVGSKHVNEGKLSEGCLGSKFWIRQ